MSAAEDFLAVMANATCINLGAAVPLLRRQYQEARDRRDSDAWLEALATCGVELSRNRQIVSRACAPWFEVRE